MLFSLTSYAQSPLMDSTALTRAGDKYYVYEVSYIDTVRTQDTGANITWDYSDATYYADYPSDSSDFALPQNRPFYCNDPKVNLVVGTPSRHSCMIRDTSGIWVTEFAYASSDSSVWVHYLYTKPERIRYPSFRFRQEYRDTSISIEDYGKGKPSDSLNKVTEYVHAKYDGYGTLKFKDKTFSSCIRIHTTLFQVDSMYYDSSYHKTYSLYERYDWYTSSMHEPVLSATLTP